MMRTANGVLQERIATMAESMTPENEALRKHFWSTGGTN